MNLLRDLAHSRYFSWLNTILWQPMRHLLNRKRMRAARHRQATVLVYSMGKVATRTIISSIEVCLNIQPIHVHVLSPEQLQRRRERNVGSSSRRSTIEFWQTVYNDVIVGSKSDVKIVTLVREPIGRNISAYFEGLGLRFEDEHAHKHVEMEKLQEIFFSEFNQRRPLVWFDDELLETTGIDVYATVFNRELGYQRIRKGKFDILIMRHDLPDNQKATCLSEFLDHPDMRIVLDNLSEDKIYHDCYREFQKTIRLSPEYVEEMLESKYARHFFPDQERELLRRKWLRLDDTRASGQETDKNTVRRLAGD